MYRAVLTGMVALGWAGSLHVCGKAADDPEDPAGVARPAEMPPNHRLLMVEAGEMMGEPGGAERLLAICRRARSAGYNGLLLWDSNLWSRELPAAYEANARALKEGLAGLEFELFIEMCPQGRQLIRWSGDDSDRKSVV